MKSFGQSSLALALSLALVQVAVSQENVNVTTGHNNNARTGLNNQETLLTWKNVNPSTFGLLFSLPVTGQIYGQPLYLAGVTIPNKGVHNVVYAVTESNWVYAFDADSNTGANAQPLWQRYLGTPVPSADTNSSNINPVIGITATPVIAVNPVSGDTIYVLAKTKEVVNNVAQYYVTLHALDATTGAERTTHPVAIGASVRGTGDGSVKGVVQFDPLIQNERPAMLLLPPTSGTGNGTLYLAFASHGDQGPYHGWIMAYNADTLAQVAVWNTTPNALSDPNGGFPIAAGGIWQGGAGLASDNTNIWGATGNGFFQPSTQAYGDSLFHIAGNGLGLLDYFTPYNQQDLDNTDTDLGSGGAVLLPPGRGSAKAPNLLIQGSKNGSIYLLNSANLGGYTTNDSGVLEELPQVIGGVFGAPAYFDGVSFWGGSGSQLEAFPIVNGKFASTTPSSSSPDYYGYPGATPSISSNGSANGIVWAVETDAFSSGGPAYLKAYAAVDLASELYDSGATSGRDDIGPAVEFVVPTITNGHVYVGTGNSIAVFGQGNWLPAVQISPAPGNETGPVTITAKDAVAGAEIYYTTDGSTPNPASAGSTLYTKPVTFKTSVDFKVKAFSSTEYPSSVTEGDYLVTPDIGSGTGLFGKYFNNTQTWSGTPTATEVDPTIDFNWNGNPPIAGNPPPVAGTNWAGEWDGWVLPEETGTYTFTTNSDDGVSVTINGQTIISDLTYHAPTLDQGTITLTKGVKATIVIQYFQGGGGSLLQLFWSSYAMPMEIVPQSQLSNNGQ